MLSRVQTPPVLDGSSEVEHTLKMVKTFLVCGSTPRSTKILLSQVHAYEQIGLRPVSLPYIVNGITAASLKCSRGTW